MKERRKLSKKESIIIVIAILLIIVLAVFAFLVLKNSKATETTNSNTESEMFESRKGELSSSAKALVINEVYSDTSDGSYIELYNASSSTIALDTYYLKGTKSDDKISLSGMTIKAGAFMVIGLNGSAGDLSAQYKLAFDGSESLSLYNADVLVDTITLPVLSSESYGRTVDGQLAFGYLTSTKGTTNAGATTLAKDTPIFSAKGGFYDSEFKLTISVPEGTTVYYTLDGSEPTEDSTLYKNGITIYDASTNANRYCTDKRVSTYGYSVPQSNVEKAMIVRAVAIDENGKKSEVVTESYFIGYSKKSGYADLPVISVVSEPDSLFGYWDGIYPSGARKDEAVITDTVSYNSSNYRQNLIANSKIQLFEGDGVLSYEGQSNISTYKDVSIEKAQKSFELTKLDNANISDKCEFASYFANDDSVILNSGREDESNVRWALVEDASEEIGLATKDRIMCALFLDGEFWGMYYIEKEYTNKYFSDKYGVNGNDVIVVEDFVVQSAGNYNEQIYPEGEGPDYTEYQAYYNELVSYASSSDLNNVDSYNQLKKMIDIDSYINAYCMALYSGNVNYLKKGGVAWRTLGEGEGQYYDGKWRYIYSDLEAGFEINELSTSSMNTFLLPTLQSDSLFQSLLKSEPFKEAFLSKFIKIATEVFSYNATSEKYSTVKNELMNRIKRNSVRYRAVKFSDGGHVVTNAEATLLGYADLRMTYMTKYLKDILGDSVKESNILLQVSNADRGTVLIDGNSVSTNSNDEYKTTIIKGSQVTVEASSNSVKRLESINVTGGTIVSQDEKTGRIIFLVDSDKVTINVKFKPSSSGE